MKRQKCLQDTLSETIRLAMLESFSKYDSRIFPEGKDYSYLYGTVKSMTYHRILWESRRRNDFLRWHTTIKAVPVKRDSGRSVRPVSAKAARSPRLLAYAKAVG